MSGLDAVLADLTTVAWARRYCCTGAQVLLHGRAPGPSIHCLINGLLKYEY